MKQMQHKWTSALLKLINSIFALPNPIACLDPQDRIRLDQSFLANSLRYVYTPLMKNYDLFKFETPKSFLLFTERLLKLTDTLLNRFKQVPDNGQKLLVSHAMPHFDLFYEEIFKATNLSQLYEIPLKFL
jgi:hypothetical protein